MPISVFRCLHWPNRAYDAAMSANVIYRFLRSSLTIYIYICIYTWIVFERKREKIVIALDTKNENEAFQLFQIIPIQIVEVIGGRIAAKYFHVKSTNSTPCCGTISSQRYRFAI